MAAEIPDYLEPVVAWRKWGLQWSNRPATPAQWYYFKEEERAQGPAFQREHHLRSAFDTVWEPGKALMAIHAEDPALEPVHVSTGRISTAV